MQTTPGTPLTANNATASPAHKPVIGLWLAVVAVVYALDQATKAWAEHALADGESRQLLGDVLQLHLAHNPGAAFSTGTGYTAVLTVVALAVIAVCVSMASRLRSPAWAIALGLVLGGALGNVTDRLLRAPAPFRGHVVDFLELPHWPIFNIADSAISLAAILFVLLSFRGIRFDGTRIDSSASASTGGDELSAS
jgi:signal peptidase II